MVFFLFYVFNGLQFIFPAEKGDFRIVITNQATTIDDWCTVILQPCLPGVWWHFVNKLNAFIGHLAVDTCCRVAQRFQNHFTNQGVILLMRLSLLDYLKKLDGGSFAENFAPQFSMCCL